MMTCPNCNAQLPDGSRFCAYCGTPFDAADAVPAEAPVAPAQPAPAASQETEPLAEQPAPAASQETEPLSEQMFDAYETEPAAQPFTPVRPEPIDRTVQPAAGQPAYAQPDGVQPAAVQPKKKKGKLALILCVALLLAAAVVGTVLFFVLRAKKNAVPNALANTGAQLQHMLGCGEGGKAIRTLQTLADGKQMTSKLQLDIDMQIDGQTQYAYYTFVQNTDGVAGLTDGTGTVTGPNGTLIFRYAAGQETLQFTMSDLDAIYSVDAATFGQMLDSSGANMLQQSTPHGRELLDSMEGKEDGSYQIQTDGGVKTATRYAVRWQLPEQTTTGAANLLTGIGFDSLAGNLLYMLSASGTIEPRAELYVCDGALIGIDLHEKDGDGVAYVRLLGAQNIWEHVRINSNNSANVLELFWTQAGDLTLQATVNGQTVQLMTVDGATGSFRCDLGAVADGDTELVASGRFYATDESSVQLSFDLDGQLPGTGFVLPQDGQEFKVSGTVKCGPMVQAPALLTDSPVSFADLSEQEQQALYSEIFMRLASLFIDPSQLNPETPTQPDEPEPTETPTEAPTETPTEAPTEAPTSDDRPSGMAEIAGTYRFSYAEYGGMTLSAEQIGFTDEWVFELDADGTAAVILGGERAESTWTLQGDSIVIDGEDLGLTYRDGVIALRYEEDGLSFDMIFVRAE